MKNWFMNLETRERLFLLGGAAVLLLLLLYVGVWQPLWRSVDSLRDTVREERSTIQWMLSSAAEIRGLQAGAGGQKTGLGGRSLLAVVDQSARSEGLGPVLKRVEPEGNDAVRVWLENAPFDALITWIANLSRQQGVAVRAITVERVPTDGWVNSRVTLTEPPK